MYRVVIVDDEYIVVEGIKTIIARENMEFEVVGCAYDGQEGTKVILREMPDLVIADIRMPGKTGLQMIEDLSSQMETEYIIISGYQEFEYARKALQLGVRGYIDKPITIDSVKDVLERTKQWLEEKNEATMRISERKKKSAYEKNSAILINMIAEEQVENSIKQTKETLRCLKEYVADIEGYKKECYKLVCLLIGMFYEGRKDPKKEHRLPSYENIRNIENYEEIDFFAEELIKSIFEKIRILKMGGIHKTIEKVLSYLEDHYNEDIGLADLAEMVDTNYVYLSTLFKEEVGMSFIKYLTQMRMDHAKKFLEEGYRVGEVSEMVGYSNYRYFTDIFKKKEGVTPNEYKGNVRKTNRS